MASLSHGIVTFPLEIRESRHKSALYRLNLPFVRETVRKILVREVSRNEGLLEVEAYLKGISSVPILSDGYMIHIENGELYLVMNGVENVSSKAFKILDKALKKRGFFGEKEVLFDRFSFLPYEIGYKDGTLKFIEVLDERIDFETGLEVIYEKSKTRPLCDRVEFYDDRVVFFAEIDARYKEEVRESIEFFHQLAEDYGIFVHVVPVILGGKIRVRGVFEDSLLAMKHALRELEDVLERRFLGKNTHARVYLGLVPVIAGAFELEHFRLPLVWGYAPKVKEKAVYVDRKLREETASESFIAFEEIPFIGRLEEIEEFIGVLENMQREKLPYLINVIGVPGVGKTRFVNEVLRFATERFSDIKVLKVEFPHTAMGNKYTAISIVARTLGVVAGNWDKISINEMADRIRLKLEELSKKHLVVVVLDNADFVDDNTLAFVKEVITSKHSPAFFLIFVSREKRIPVHLSHEKYHTITLYPVTRETLKFIVLELLGAFPSNEFVEFIYDNTQGIPLYVIELLSRLKRDGKLAVRNGQVFIEEMPERVLSLEDILRDFYKRLSGTPAKVMLDIMSVFSGNIPLHIMESVFVKIRPKADFEEAVRALFSTNLVEFRHLNFISPGITLAFKNDLFKEIILETMAPNWHGRIRNLIVKVLKEDARLPSIFKYQVIAGYLKDAGDLKGYIEYMLKAAEEFIRMNAYDIARELMLKVKKYESIVPNKYEFYKTLTTVLVQTGNYSEARKAYEKVLECDREDESFKIPLGIIVYVGVGKNEKAEELFKKLDINKVREREKGHVYNALGVLYYRLGKYGKAVDYLYKARKFLTDNDAMYIANLSNMASTYERMGKYAEALGIIDEAIGIARGIYHSQHLMGLYHNKAIIHIHLGEYEKAISDLEESAFWAENMKLSRTVSYIYNTKGILHFEFGKYREAVHDLNRAYNSVLKTEDERQKSSILANLGYAKTHLGEWNEAENNLSESKRLRENLEDQRGLSYTLFYMGELERQRERYETAKSYFETSMNIKEEVGDRMGMLYVMAQNSFLHTELEDYESAYKIARRGLKLAEELSDVHAILLLRLALASVYIGFGELKKVSSILDEVKKELSHRNHHHLEGLLYYLSGVWKLKRGAYTPAFSEFLNAREKFVLTGEKKALAKTVERLIEIMNTHSVYYMNSDALIKDAHSAIEFYRKYGLSRRAENLSLMLSRL